MRTTVTLDDALLAEVEALSGIHDRSQLLREALLEMRHRLASQRLALLAGSEPGVVAPPRKVVQMAAEPEPAPYLSKKRARSRS
ncbi:MAG: type II toxin-antitoxin system VapB family antitoxin [Rhodocyclaceae bacterium]|jgi:hypothetical protein|nr:type II toxin-antitoxin system VapB family antitoxin [Rhodocyclaceae bacterium]